MNWLKYVTAMVALLVAIKQLVVEFEHPGFGPEKKKAVLDTLAVFYDTAKEFMDLPVTKEQVLAAADKLIDIVVGFYNLVGIFQHSPKTPQLG
ncbi:MAG: hypothetical protein IMW99_04060 [Firmicutes bacterium]|nr:hypothetical protein [Bacillota bacterium]